MMSQIQQVMLQQQQEVETTPGQSQKLFKTPETVNLTEKRCKLTPKAQQATQ